MQTYQEQSSFRDPEKCFKSIQGYDVFVDGGIITSKGESTIIEIENEEDQNCQRRFFESRRDFGNMNLIVTCARHLEPETEEELRDILKELRRFRCKSFNYKNVWNFDSRNKT